MKKIIILSMAVLALSACTGGEKIPVLSTVKEKVEKVATATANVFSSNLKQDLNNKEFKIESEGYGKNSTIGFEGNRVFGSSGINRYFGTFEVKGDKLVFSQFGLTKMAGSQEEMIKELKFLTNLKDNANAKLEGDTLTLTSDAGMVMVFKYSKAVTEK